MPNRISAITPQKKRPSRYNIFIDGEFAFSLSACLAMTLHPGDRLSKAAIRELQKTDETEQAFEKALYYLKFRPRSRVEITGYLEKKQFGRKASEDAVKRLEHYNYIDDAAFARFWVESREIHRPRGVFALRWELRNKGIDEETIEKALSDYDEPGAAWRAVSPKLSAWSKLPEPERKAKMYNFLRQRGFAFETCRLVHARASAAITGETQ